MLWTPGSDRAGGPVVPGHVYEAPARLSTVGAEPYLPNTGRFRRRT